MPRNGTYKNQKTTVLSMCWAFLSIKISSWKSLSFFVEMSHFEIVSPLWGQEVEKKIGEAKVEDSYASCFQACRAVECFSSKDLQIILWVSKFASF